jgi:hypothetical protein
MEASEIRATLARWSMPEPNSGCWIWLRSVDTSGYGRLFIDKKQVSAHRTAYEVYIGPIPEGKEIDHLCRVRCCINPVHLEPVTDRENALRGNGGMFQASKTHCPQGHPLIAGNLRAGPRRACLTCHREREARRRMCHSDSRSESRRTAESP